MSDTFTAENESSLKFEDFLSFWVIVNASSLLLCRFLFYFFLCLCLDGSHGWTESDAYGVDRSGLPGSVHPWIVSSSAAFQTC